MLNFGVRHTQTTVAVKTTSDGFVRNTVSGGSAPAAKCPKAKLPQSLPIPFPEGAKMSYRRERYRQSKMKRSVNRVETTS